MSNEGDWVLDPFLGTGTTVIAAIRHNRRGAGAEVYDKYLAICHDRIRRAMDGTLRTRPMDRPVYDPFQAGNKLAVSAARMDLFNACREKSTGKRNEDS